MTQKMIKFRTAAVTAAAVAVATVATALPASASTPATCRGSVSKPKYVGDKHDYVLGVGTVAKCPAMVGKGWASLTLEREVMPGISTTLPKSAVFLKRYAKRSNTSGAILYCPTSRSGSAYRVRTVLRLNDYAGRIYRSAWGPLVQVKHCR